MDNTTIGTKLTNTHRLITVKSPVIPKDVFINSSDGITKIDNPKPIIYVNNPTITPVYSQSDPSTVIGTTVIRGNTSTTTYNSSASVFDKIDSTTLMYVTGGALVLYLLLY